MHSLRTHGLGLLTVGLAAMISQTGMAATKLADIDATVNDAARKVMEQHGIPGLAIAITAQGQQRFYNFGLTSKTTQQPVTRDTLFEVGSVSKTLTATLAAYAEAEGKLSLTDSPGRHLPALQDTALEPVSLINLATHTAGGFPLQLPDEVGDEQQLNDYFSTWQPQHTPGSYRIYANPSIGLLGRATAASLGLSYTDALQTQLLPKLGMSSTYIAVPTGDMPRYAQGYNQKGEPVRLNPALLAAEAYGVKTTSEDLLKFVEAQLGVIKIDDKVIQAMAATRTGYYRVGEMTQALVWEQYRYPVALKDLLVGNSSKMALEPHPVETITPPLAPQLDVWINKTGSTNGFGAYVAFVPARQLGIVILANRYYPNEERVKLAYRILTHLAE
ncbi:class C beta-lactamase [Stutzerimonas zhaodongensis]|nr:class C beta-lactamase [Stutzerimonas zhaodongensis]MCQ4317668.1 beta-lactamase [Stutzerimonas zhaodongensis]